MDTSIVPLGERAQRTILDHVVAVGDEAEARFLEAKSSLDLTTTADVVTVAKFLLGSANRRPEDAMRHFEGHAVLVIGAAKGSAAGVPRGVEPHELEDRLHPYLGPQFPGFEFGRIPVADEREVLFVVALPPRDGQSIFPCHKDYQGTRGEDTIEDGGVYVRGASNTRKARAGEVLSLVERARGTGKSQIDLDVEIIGLIGRVVRVDEVMADLYSDEEERFTNALRTSDHSAPAAIAIAGVLGIQQSTRQQRAERLAEWKREVPAYMERGRAHFLGVVLPGIAITVVSRDRFVAKPRLTVTFHDCETFDYIAPDDAKYEQLVEPITKPGNLFGTELYVPPPSIYPRDYPVEWGAVGDDVEVHLTPDSFRPNSPWASDGDDFVLLARDLHAQEVTATWFLTEDGNDATTTGELRIALGEVQDAGNLVVASFFGET